MYIPNVATQPNGSHDSDLKLELTKRSQPKGAWGLEVLGRMLHARVSPTYHITQQPWTFIV